MTAGEARVLARSYKKGCSKRAAATSPNGSESKKQEATNGSIPWCAKHVSVYTQGRDRANEKACRSKEEAVIRANEKVCRSKEEGRKRATKKDSRSKEEAMIVGGGPVSQPFRCESEVPNDTALNEMTSKHQEKSCQAESTRRWTRSLNQWCAKHVSLMTLSRDPWRLGANTVVQCQREVEKSETNTSDKAEEISFTTDPRRHTKRVKRQSKEVAQRNTSKDKIFLVDPWKLTKPVECQHREVAESESNALDTQEASCAASKTVS